MIASPPDMRDGRDWALADAIERGERIDASPNLGLPPETPCPRCAFRLLPSRYPEESAICLSCGYISYRIRAARKVAPELLIGERPGRKRKSEQARLV